VTDEQKSLEALLLAQTEAALLKAEEERLRRLAEEAAAEETRRLRIATQRRARDLEEAFERYAHQAEQTDGLAKLLREYLERQPAMAIIGEWFEELSERFSSLRTELAEMHQETKSIDKRLGIVIEILRVTAPARRNGQKAELDALFKQADAEAEIADLRQELVQHRRRRAKLLEQKAAYGLETPAHILTQIEDAQAQIERLEQELR
jgi:hypothetical protein